MLLFSPVTAYTFGSVSVVFLRSHAFPCFPFLFLLITLKKVGEKKQPKKKKKSFEITNETDFGLSFLFFFFLLERFKMLV